MAQLAPSALDVTSGWLTHHTALRLAPPTHSSGTLLTARRQSDLACRIPSALAEESRQPPLLARAMDRLRAARGADPPTMYSPMHSTPGIHVFTRLPARQILP